METSAFVRLSKQTSQTTSLETHFRPQECRAGRKVGATAAGGGGGGSDGRPDQNGLMGLREREFQAKASRIER